MGWTGKIMLIVFASYSHPIRFFFKGEFNFCEAFSGEKNPGDARYKAGESLLSKYTSSNSFRETDMFKILRDKESGICRPRDVGFPTQGSQVSI